MLESSQTGATQAEMARFFLQELKKNVGIGIIEDLVLFGRTDADGITAPLSFRSLQANMPRCTQEQLQGMPCQP